MKTLSQITGTTSVKANLIVLAALLLIGFTLGALIYSIGVNPSLMENASYGL